LVRLTTIRTRHTLSSAVHYWSAAATVSSYLQDALLVQQLPASSELADGDEAFTGQVKRVASVEHGCRTSVHPSSSCVWCCCCYCCCYGIVAPVRQFRRE
jgi:hypothetical protein